MQIDWLSINYIGTLGQTSKFIKKELNYKSKYFNSLCEYHYEMDLFCTVESLPSSPVLPAGLVQVKIANKWLYHAGLQDLINMWLSDHLLKFHSYSRLDICYDFNIFANSLHPETFIRRFINQYYIKKGKSSYSIRGKNNKSLKHEYLKFGSRYSDISVYLYNKTVELSEVHDKPYIRKQWEQNKLNTKNDIWRLEFTLKGNNIKLLEKSSGALVERNENFIYNHSNLEQLYASLVNQYFSFYFSGNQKNKSRLKPIELFKNFVPEFKLLRLTEERDSNRSERMLISKLLKVYDELRIFKEDSAHNYYDMAVQAANEYNLKNYFLKIMERIHPDEPLKILHAAKNELH